MALKRKDDVLQNSDDRSALHAVYSVSGCGCGAAGVAERIRTLFGYSLPPNLTVWQIFGDGLISTG